MVARARVKA